MAKYSTFKYNDGTKYGELALLSFNAEPVECVAIDYDTVQVTWKEPKNSLTESFTALRLLRSQDSFAETEEDGAILYEFLTASGQMLTSFEDGPQNNSLNAPPLQSGRFAYYTVWLLIVSEDVPAGAWVPVGKTFALIPGKHQSTTTPNSVYSSKVTTDGASSFVDKQISPKENFMDTHDRFLAHLPRVLTSSVSNSLDVPDADSPLNKFLKGFTFTMDEFLSYADLLLASRTGMAGSPNVIAQQTHEYGLPVDPQGGTREQRALIREANYMYSRKGTPLGLQTFVEHITGFDADITTSPNLFLSKQDATFWGGSSFSPTESALPPNGFWVPGRNTEITVARDQALPLSEDYYISVPGQAPYVGSITVSQDNSSIRNGIDRPLTRGIPIVGSTSYTFSFYAKYNADPGVQTTNIITKVYWFNSKGVKVGESSVTDAAGVSSWEKISLVATSPSTAVFAGVELTFSIDGPYFVTMFQLAETSRLVAGEYYEPRAVQIKLRPEKINYVLNPSFEEDADNWTISPSATNSIEPLFDPEYDGPLGVRSSENKWQITTPSSGEFSVKTVTEFTSVDTFYTASIYMKSSATKTVEMSLGVYKDSFEDITSKNITLTTNWQRFQVTHYATDDHLVDAELRFEISGLFGGAVIQLDCAQIEQSFAATDYFDGSMEESGAAWVAYDDLIDEAFTIDHANGDAYANNGVSVIYPNIDMRALRLDREIDGFLARNTPYIIDWWANSTSVLKYRGITV